MLRLLSSKAQKCKDFWKPSKHCQVGIHLKALAEYSQMSTHLPGFRSFFRFFALYCIGQISHQQHKGYKEFLVNSVLANYVHHVNILPVSISCRWEIYIIIVFVSEPHIYRSRCLLGNLFCWKLVKALRHLKIGKLERYDADSVFLEHNHNCLC